MKTLVLKFRNKFGIPFYFFFFKFTHIFPKQLKNISLISRKRPDSKLSPQPKGMKLKDYETQVILSNSYYSNFCIWLFMCVCIYLKYVGVTVDC